MSITYFAVKSVSRRRGRSAVGKAAYDARERLRDERTKRTYDFRARGGLEHAEIFAPSSAAEDGTRWIRDRGALWNAAEAAERQKNARVAREYVVGLPHELKPEQRLALARRFAQSIADRYGVAADLAVHSPPRGGDRRNFHAHVLATTRELTTSGFGRKSAIERSDSQRREMGLPRVAEEIKFLRRRWTELANEHLREAGLEQRLDPRRLREQGIDRIPRRPLSRAVIEIERRGGHSYVAEWDRREHAQRQREQLIAAETVARAPALLPTTERGATPQDAMALTTIAERQRSAIERWRAYRPTDAPEPAHVRSGLTREREHEHEFGLDR